MTILIDSNVLLRLADPKNPAHAIASGAIAVLNSRSDDLCVVPQSLYEFWVVATRPVAHNGLGLSTAECLRELGSIRSAFRYLNDLPNLYDEWETLVATHACHGKIAHDARYIAAMRTHHLTQLLTFNVRDFARFPGIVAIDPASVTPAATP